MTFINESQVIGGLIQKGTEMTGSLFLTLLTIIVLIIALAMIFRIPIEWTMIIILPVLLVSMAYSSEWLAIGGLTLIYLAILFVKWLFGR